MREVIEVWWWQARGEDFRVNIAFAMTNAMLWAELAQAHYIFVRHIVVGKEGSIRAQSSRPSCYHLP